MLFLRQRRRFAHALEQAEARSLQRDRQVADLQRDIQQHRATAEALRVAQQRLQTAMEVGRVGTWVYEIGTQTVTGDEAIRRLVAGSRADDPHFMPDLSAAIIHDEDRAAFETELEASQRESRDFSCDYRIVRADGVIRWLRSAARREVDAQGQLLRLVGASQDITERKQAELLVAGQNQVLSMIASGAPLTETLHRLLCVVEDIERDMLCSLLLLDDDGVHVHPVAAPRLPEAYTRALEGASIGPHAGSCGTAMYERRPVVVSDIASDPLWTDYRALALRHGLRACWSTPVVDALGQVLGAFAIYALQPGMPQPRHEHVIRAVTRTAAIAIESRRGAEALHSANQRLEHEVRERAAAEAELRTSREILHTALDHARMRAWVLELDQKSIRLEGAGRQSSSLIPGEGDALLAREGFRDSLHPDDRDRVMEALEAAILGERDYDVEFRMCSPDGQWRWIATRALLQRDGEGRPRRLLGASFDITERRNTEALIAGQNAVLAMIASGAPLESTLDALLKVVETSFGGRCWSSIVLLDSQQILRAVSAPSLPAEYRSFIGGPVSGPGVSACGMVVERGEVVICPDIRTDPLWSDHREEALQLGVCASWSAPIFDSSRRVIGSLSVFSARAGQPSAANLRTLDIATHTASIAVENAWAAQAALEAKRSLEREVVERRQTEARLHEARAQLQSALTHARMGSWTMEVATRQLCFDDALLRVFGGAGSRGNCMTLEHHVAKYVYEPDRERVAAEIEAALKGEAGYDTEYRVYRPDHGAFWLSAKGFVIRDAEGHPVRIVGISRDISERKRDELLIAGQNRILTMIAGGAPLGDTLDVLEKLIEETEAGIHCTVWVLDEDGLQLRMMTSKRHLSAKGIRTVLLMSQDGGPSVEAVRRQQAVVTVDTATDPLWQSSRATAREHGIRACWAMPIFDSARRVIGTFALYSPDPGAPQRRHQQAIDIAVQTAAIAIESAHAAEALRNSKVLLEQKVAERTRDLKAANERLLEVDRLKSQFLANMSHELRTPLNAILGFAGTLLMKLPGPLNDEQQSQLGIIRNSAQHLLSLINDLLDLAKIESGKMSLRVEVVDCVALVNEVASTLQPLADRKRLQLVVDVPQTPVPATTDERALKQIVINLANNAIKFTDRGRVLLGVRVVMRDQSPWIEISVTDTGIGIREEDRERLFIAFSQMDGTVREGTGLGLHLSQKFAELIGGRIELHSEFGRGSRFSLIIPGDAP